MSGTDAEFAARRLAARKELDAIDPFMTGAVDADPRRYDWFCEVYLRAAGDAARVPWADLAAHPLTAEWLREHGPGLRGRKVLDVGCGLGDNAEAFATFGAEVTAFDLAPGAIEWAHQRFPSSTVEFLVADLFALPPEWRGTFDLVHECYTLQALPDSLLPAARHALADALKPGGRLLLVARGRLDDAPPKGPPWPLSRGDLEAFATAGLLPESIEAIEPDGKLGRHWRAVFRKAGS